MSAAITHSESHRGNRERPKPWENVEEREITLIQRFLLHTSPLNPPEHRGPEMGRLHKTGPQIRRKREGDNETKTERERGGSGVIVKICNPGDCPEA